MLWSWDGPLDLSECGQGDWAFIPLQWLFTGYGLLQGGGVTLGKVDLFSRGNFCWELTTEGDTMANTLSSWRNRSFSSERGRSGWNIRTSEVGQFYFCWSIPQLGFATINSPKVNLWHRPWIASGAFRYLILHCEGVKVRSLKSHVPFSRISNLHSSKKFVLNI